MNLSVFEVIGPIMVGPSSSHTAGMVRIGMMTHNIVGEPMKDIFIRFSPKMHHTYSGHRSDAGLIGGAIGMKEDSPELKNAIKTAHERGITTSVDYLEEGKYPQNTALMHITCVSGRVVDVLGTSVGGGSIRIMEIDGIPVKMNADAYHIVVWSKTDITVKCKKIEGTLQVGKTKYGFLFVLTFLSVPQHETVEYLQAIDAVEKVSLVPPALQYGVTLDSVEPIKSCEHALAIAEKNKISLSEVAIRYEMKRSGFSREEIFERMRTHYAQMRQSVLDGQKPDKELCYGLVDGAESLKLLNWAQSGNSISGGLIPIAASRAMGVMESNGSMGCVVAAPTAGSAGVVPGSFSTVQDHFRLTDDKVVEALFVGALAGVIMDNRGVTFSGSIGGCQAEVGVSSSLTAAGIASMFSDDNETPFHSMAICLKNILGLVCDPLAGPVEVPCIKRNVIGVANAFISSDLALAGIRSFVPPDEVIDALADAERRLPTELKCSSIGGLASTNTAKQVRKMLNQE